MATKTLLVLDVDGVVFPMRHPAVTPAADENTYEIAIPPRIYGRLHVRPAVIEAVNRWALSGADVRWLTSWGFRTQWLHQVGLPSLPVLYEPEPGEVFMWGRSGLSWKRPAMARFLDENSGPIRLAWADDDTFYTAYPDELRSTHPQLSDLLLVQPDCFIGLTNKDIHRIDAFLSS